MELIPWEHVLSFLVNLGGYILYRIKTKREITTVYDAVQISGQEEADEIVELRKEIDSLKSEIQSLKNHNATGSKKRTRKNSRRTGGGL